MCRRWQDQEDHQDPLALLELTGSRVTLVKMEKLVKLDLLVFLELLGVLDPKERKENEVKVSQDLVGLQGFLAHRDHHLALIGLHLWTWRALDLIWTVCGQCPVCLACLGLLVPLVSPVPLALGLQALVALGLLVLPGKMELQVNRDFQVHQVLMENQAYLAQKAKRVMPVSWAYLDLWERRVPKVLPVPLAFLERVDLLVFQDQWDLLDHLVLLAQAIMLVLMIWRALVFTSVQSLE